MLEIHKWKISIDHKILVDEIDLVINKSDKIAIIGEEGNGKSTLLKSFMGGCEYAQIQGSMHPPSLIFGYVKQSLHEQELIYTVHDFIFKNMDEYIEHCAQFYRLLTQFKLHDSIEEQCMSSLSGGEKVKIQLLKILLFKSDVLLLDEPTNDLDIDTLEWLASFILACEQPIIFVSHDETLLSTCANRILHLEQLNKQNKCRTTIANIGYQVYVQTRLHRHQKDTQIAAYEKASYKKKAQRLNDIKNAVHDAQNDTVRNPAAAALLKKKMRSIKAMETRLDKQELPTVDSLEEDINIFFPTIALSSKKRILDIHIAPFAIQDRVLSSAIDLQVYGPKHIGIVGCNGCGKTTLLHRIYTHLQDTLDLPIGYMPQNYDSLWDTNQSAIEFICPSQKKEEITQARQWLGSVNFTRDEMIACIYQLSGGSKAKLILLSLIKNAYPVLLLDEPTRNISPLSSPVIRNALMQYQGCIISVSHDRLYLEEVCDKVYELSPTGLHIIT